ncbi:hypothetical protein HNQ10_003492 [Deinococcus metallilatus]|uniref:Uncharacterized protein n=1 Tax=Deinococcus metallilatus TaxID=1211322 RepID=A0ABR6MXG6_9DEIO|nr:hypothetical protein [Deinococcus metallilatus]
MNSSIGPPGCQHGVPALLQSAPRDFSCVMAHLARGVTGAPGGAGGSLPLVTTPRSLPLLRHYAHLPPRQAA